LSSWSIIYVFLSYGEGKNGYHYFDPITQKLYICFSSCCLSRAYTFLFYSIHYS
jgi:hypothetical protein